MNTLRDWQRCQVERSTRSWGCRRAVVGCSDQSTEVDMSTLAFATGGPAHQTQFVIVNDGSSKLA